MRRTIGMTCLLALIATPAAAQHWDTPTLFSPALQDDIGGYLIKPDGRDWGVIGIWRQSGGINLGVRGGIGGSDGNRTVLLGAELFGPLDLAGTSPFRFAWVSGIGASINGVTSLRIPFGVSVGGTLGGAAYPRITPYVHPRAALDIFTFDVGDDEETETELNVDVDVGADLDLSSTLVLRFGATVGDFDVIGIGLGVRTGRGVVVR